MSLDSLVDSIANRADELLSDARGLSDARAILIEVLSAEQPRLTGVERQKVADAVVHILQDEGFFDTMSSKDGDSWSEGGEASDEE